MRTLKLMPLLALGVAVAFTVASCVIPLRSGEDQATPESALAKPADPIASDLINCRSVSSEQTESYEHCRRIWAENRARFLGARKKPAASAGTDKANRDSTDLGKDQSRLPQGATPSPHAGTQP